MQNVIKISFTTFVVLLIVLPLPPSTIIGLIIANHPKTNKFMIPQAVTVSKVAVGFVGAAFVWKFNLITKGKTQSAENRLQQGVVYL